MTKRSLYVCLTVLTLTLRFVVPRAEAQEPSPRVCAACVTPVVGAGATLLLPANLHGLLVLIRATQDRTQDLIPAVEHIRERGGRPGLIVDGSAGAPDEEAAFALKLRLLELRGAARADVVLAVQAPAAWGRERLAAVAPYVDVIVRPGGAAAAQHRDLRVWPLVEASTLEGALASTTTGGAEQWVVELPRDVLDARALLHGLAEAAAPPPDALVESVEVRAARRLTAREIVARHQAMMRRQAAAVHRTIASGVTTLTFEAPGFPAPVTITTETVIYQSGGRTELEQRAVRVNGIEFRGSGVPRLPIIEPERVATPPLAIALSDVYSYRLAGDDTIRGVRCHVVDFAPGVEGATLFRGRAWIAMDSFAALRIHATQTALRGPIVSSEQIDDFREAAPGVWLLGRSEVRQLYEGAAHRTPIQRVLEIASHEINPPQFDARLQAAYQSSSLMLRDTAQGFRYLTREAIPGTAAGGGTPEVKVTEVASRAERIRTIAAGVIIDPNISIPLPFAGISYVDFNLFDTGTQLNAFFGGSYAQLAFSVPSLGGSRWQVAGRAFGIASEYNDRSFREGREIYAENIRQRPAHVSAWLLRPLSARVSFRAGYELDYTRLRRAPETAADFEVPADQVVHGARVALEGQRGGWSGSLWWNPARRAGWRPWGRRTELVDGVATDSDYRPSDDTFQRYGLTVARSMAVTPTFVTRLEGSAMSGTDLDRFSRYTFGTFDNRLRGYPAALIRYDRGAVLRGVTAWSASRFARVDGFVDTAMVRDRGFGRGYRNYTGVGAALEAPAPFGILASVEWGYGFRGVNANGRTGTHVIRVSAFKVF